MLQGDVEIFAMVECFAMVSKRPGGDLVGVGVEAQPAEAGEWGGG